MKIIVYINLFLTILLITCFGLFVFNYQKTQTTTEKTTVVTEKTDKVTEDACGLNCKKQIEDSVALALATISATPKVVTNTNTSVPAVKAKTQISYIPLSGTITTVSSSWYDAPGTDFYLDIEKNYSKTYTATWNAMLKVAHGNGVAYARLFDVTHGIAVNGSEVSLTDNPDLTQVYSQNLSFWSGNNLYRVQLKSLNTFEVTFGGGSVKIVY